MQEQLNNISDPIKPVKYNLKSYETDLNNWERVKGQWDNMNRIAGIKPATRSDLDYHLQLKANIKSGQPLHESQKKGWDSAKQGLSLLVKDYLGGFKEDKLYTKDELGMKVPNMSYITEISTDLAKKSGITTNAVKSHLENEISNQLSFKLKEPELEKRLQPEKDKLEAKMKKEGATSILAPEEKKNIDKEFSTVSNGYLQNNKALKKSIEGQLQEKVQPIKAKFDEVKTKYTGLHKEIQQQVNAQAQQELNTSLQNKLDELTQLVVEGKVGKEKAQSDYAAFEDEAKKSFDESFDKRVNETFEQQYGKEFRETIEPLQSEIKEYTKWFSGRLGAALKSNFEDYTEKTKELSKKYSPVISKAYSKKLSDMQIGILNDLFKEDEAKRKDKTDMIYDMLPGGTEKAGYALYTSAGKALGDMLASFGRVSRSWGLDKLPINPIEVAAGSSFTDKAIGVGEGLSSQFNLPTQDITWNNFFTPRVLGEGVGSQIPNIVATTAGAIMTGGIGGGAIAAGLDAVQETGGYIKELEQRGELPSDVSRKSNEFFVKYGLTSSPIEALTSMMLLKGGKNLITKLGGAIVGEGAQGGLGETIKQGNEGVGLQEAIASKKVKEAAIAESKAAIPMELAFAAFGLKLKSKAPSAAAQHYSNLSQVLGGEKANQQLEQSFSFGLIDAGEFERGKKLIEVSKVASLDADNLGLEGGQKNMFVGLTAELSEIKEKLETTTTPAAKKVIEEKIKEHEKKIDEAINKPESIAVVETSDLGQIAVHVDDAKELLQDEDFKEAVLNGDADVTSEDADVTKEVATIKELVDMVERSPLQGGMRDMAEQAVRSGNPDGFFKEVADQALNKVGDLTPDEINYNRAVELFGQEIVDKAVKMFPKEETKAVEKPKEVKAEEVKEVSFLDTPIKPEDASKKTSFNFKDPITGSDLVLKGKVSSVRLAMKKKIDTFEAIIKCLG